MQSSSGSVCINLISRFFSCAYVEKFQHGGRYDVGNLFKGRKRGGDDFVACDVVMATGFNCE